MSISRCGPVNPSTPTFPNINFTKRMTKMLLQKSLKNGCNNLCFCHYTFNMVYKSFPQLTSLSRRGSVNPSISIFGITNLKEAMANSIAAWKFNQKQLKSLFLHPEAFKFIFRSNSCLPSISRCCPVTPSTHTFPNISLYKGDGKFTYCLEND